MVNIADFCNVFEDCLRDTQFFVSRTKIKFNKNLCWALSNEDFHLGLELHLKTSLAVNETNLNSSFTVSAEIFNFLSGTTLHQFPELDSLSVETEEDVIGSLSALVDYVESCCNHDLIKKKSPACPVCGGFTRNSKKGIECVAGNLCTNVLVLQQKYPFENLPSRLKAPAISGHNVDLTPSRITTRDSEQNVLPSFVIDLADEDNCAPTKEYPYLKYPFDYFNRVQSAVLRSKVWLKRANLVCGTATSTGKTITAELPIIDTLLKKKKVLYVSPLKSLTQEKYNDWKVRFKDYKIEILTGDYSLSDTGQSALDEADILCVTSEMVDSKTRNYSETKSSWISNVGLLILDEAHIISTNRGHAVEVGMMRFSFLVPSAKIWFLSATLPNVKDFVNWLNELNHLPTYVINSDWRPTKLTWHFIEHSKTNDYEESIADKKQKALNCVIEKQDEKYLVFVHDKTIGRSLERMFLSKGINCKFHNADLPMRERLSIEESFSNRSRNSTRVLISTSTLAWGRTLPARNVVIVGVSRGRFPVDELDIIQMAGRAGRLGVDVEGDCYLICDDKNAWKHKVTNPRLVKSTLLEEDYLGFHVLAEIRNGVITTDDSIFKWFERSLAFLQLEINTDLIQRVLSTLKSWGMIIKEDDIYHITSIGSVSAALYFMPKDINHLNVGFSKLKEQGLLNNDIAITYILGTIPSYSLAYVPRSEADRVREYTDLVKSVFKGKVIQSVVSADLYDIFNGEKGLAFARTIQADMPRLTEALVWLNSIKKWQGKEAFSEISIKTQYGVTGPLAELCKIKGIGVERAKILHDNGVLTLSDIIKNQAFVGHLLGKKVAMNIVENAKISRKRF